ncbi:hypothetical protein [Metabacillus idriensis]|uniref:hypothetical protein n=1 Tax=Metabacillus idriensis TaxID=324768 RepID=UPI00174C6405|nr:hypothetical protein [Metabacillus idriensis]
MASLSFDQLIYLAVITAISTAILTMVGNSIFHWLKNKFDWFQETKKFKRDYYFEQLKELYIPLYAVIAQSEFLRGFYDLSEKPKEEIPFIESHETKSRVVTDLGEGTIKREVVKLSNEITEFNKEKIAKTIIDKGVYSSQELLKLAVSYRYVHKYYMDESLNPRQLEKFRTLEIKLINEIVELVVKECNEKLKECDMPYNQKELNQEKILIDYNVSEKI